MPTTEDSTRAIGRAKAAVDNGFSRVGRTLSSGDRVAGWLHACAGRAVALCDAIILLCREHHAAEAAPLARAVIQLAADMRWVAAGEGLGRLERWEKDAGARDWGALWSAASLQSRLEEAGLSAAEARDRAEGAARLCAGHLVGGSSGLPWAHAFSGAPASLTSEETLDATARALSGVLNALNQRWPGYFAP